MKKCTNNALDGERSCLLLGRIVEGRIHESASHRLSVDIIPQIQNKSILRIIRYDWLLISFGNQMCLKYPENFHDKDVRAKLRMCGRLLCELKSINQGITDFASLYQPIMYDSVIQAVRNISQFDVKSNEFKTPSTALDALLQVKDVGKVLVCEYIKKENQEWQTKTENFLKLLNSEAGATVYKSIYASQAKMKRSVTERIPTTTDVKLLSNYLDVQIEKVSKTLEKRFSYNDWFKLSELTSAWIIVFNRKRTGETKNILVTEFDSRESVSKETIGTLSADDKVVAECFSRMKVRGKSIQKLRTVPVLLKPEIEKAINLLLKNRKAANISDENTYLFALPSCTQKKKVVDTCGAIRKFSVECGAKDLFN